MKRLVQSEQMIRNTRKKFILFSIVGITLVVGISLVAFQYHRYVIGYQAEVQKLNEIRGEQLQAIHEIVTLGEKLADRPSQNVEDEIKNEIQRLLSDLKLRNRNFVALVNSPHFAPLKEIQVFLQEKNLDSQLESFMISTQAIVAIEPESRDTLSSYLEEIHYQARSGLADTLETLGDKIKTENSEALRQLDRMGLLLIALCFLEIALVWLLVFRPVYSTVLTQHEKLSEAVEEVENANKSRGEFLANISHEIRTPMTGILGYAELLQKKGNLEPEQRSEAIKIINQNAAHLLSLIDEILDVSKIDSGKMSFKKEEINLATLLREVFTALSFRANKKGLMLRFMTKGDIPRLIESDNKRLKQVLYNVIGNAIKFTDQGSVELTVAFEKARSGARLVFTVKDTGCGISDENKTKLFRPFEQADSSVSRDYGGTGLGLVLSRAIARNLGGDVTIAGSRVGVGTTMKIEIDPGPKAHQNLTPYLENEILGDKAKKSSPSLSLEGKSILVVDDAQENARIFQIYLTKAGAQVEIANGGQEAIDKAEQKDFDVILLDIQMPGKDGFQVLAELRQKSYSKPIIALTAHAMEEERRKTMAAGFDGHLTKPIQSKELISSINQHFNALA